MKALVSSLMLILLIAGTTLGIVRFHEFGLSTASRTRPNTDTDSSPNVMAAALSPTTTPRIVRTLPTASARRSFQSRSENAAIFPAPVVIASRSIAASLESECDAAYPDADTCIPPGPPFDQGCAITKQRRFTVLPPDPQALDADGDGVGCEPI